MCEILNQSSDDDDEEDDGDSDGDDNKLAQNASSLSICQSSLSSFVICAPEILPKARSVLKYPTRSQAYSLYLLFMANVDPVLKMLHGFSLQRYMVEEIGQLNCSPRPKGWNALKFAIYYATMTSLTPDECLQRLGEEKAVLLPRFRSSTELALARADFIKIEGISTLQALVLYLVSHSFTFLSSPFRLMLTWIALRD